MYTVFGATPLISTKWDAKLDETLSPIPVLVTEISSSVPSIGLVKFTVTLKMQKLTTIIIKIIFLWMVTYSRIFAKDK